MSIEIRDASTADIEPWDEVYPAGDTIERDVQDGTAVIVVADQAIAGFAVLNEHQDPDYGEVPWSFASRTAVIHRMMVAPSIEGRGIARADDFPRKPRNIGWRSGVPSNSGMLSLDQLPSANWMRWPR